ncbi:MAG: PQQ-binding-like beta-propeller repeat protein, partial [Planctomycetota bacterium]
MRTATLFCLLTLTAAAGENRHEWPQYKGGPGFHGWSPDESVKPPLKLLWEFRTDGDGSGDAGGGVIVAEDKVFLGVWMNSTILCIDARDGKFLWSSKKLPGYGGRSVPGYYGGKVYVWITRPNRMKVIALDAETGKTVWETPLKGSSSLSSTRTGLAIAEDKVFCVDHGEDPAVRALDAATGKQVWRTSLGKGYGTSAIQPCYAGGRVFAGVTNRQKKKLSGATVALDAKTGKELWRREKIFPNTTPSTDGKIVAVCMDTLEDSHTYGLDVATGKTVVKIDKPGFSRRTPTITPDLILSKYYGNNFSTADRRTGKVLWRFHPLNTGCNTPIVAGGYCYFGSGRPQGFKSSPMDAGGKGFCN